MKHDHYEESSQYGSASLDLWKYKSGLLLPISMPRYIIKFSKNALDLREPLMDKLTASYLPIFIGKDLDKLPLKPESKAHENL